MPLPRYVRRTTILAYALMPGSCTEDFVAVFEKFVEMAGGAPDVMFADRCASTAAAAAEVMPQTKLRLCIWHLRNNLYENLPKHLRAGLHQVSGTDTSMSVAKCFACASPCRYAFRFPCELVILHITSRTGVVACLRAAALRFACECLFVDHDRFRLDMPSLDAHAYSMRLPINAGCASPLRSITERANQSAVSASVDGAGGVSGQSAASAGVHARDPEMP